MKDTEKEGDRKVQSICQEHWEKTRASWERNRELKRKRVNAIKMKNARIKSIKQSRDNEVQVLKAETMAAIKVTNKSTRQKMRYEDLAKTQLDKLKQANKLIVNLKANIHDDGVS